jgi:hypothetical protein
MVHGNICQLNLFQSLRGRKGIQEAESLGGRDDVIIMIS